jgi:methanogenic corrinoid protein MtbC1
VDSESAHLRQRLREASMQRESPRAAAVQHDVPDPCLTHPPLPVQAFSSLVARNNAAKERLAHLARTIEADVIPRLVQAHRYTTPAANTALANLPMQTAKQVAAFVDLIVGDSEAEIHASVDAKRRSGMSVEALYLDLFAPAARLLGDMWLDDKCDFSTVTVALGRLQRLLRELSPSFGTEVEYPANGRRVLFAQPADEQHSFGLSMVAEFFRREGWDVVGVVGGSADDPGLRLRREWADVVGFSIGSELRLEWLRQRIAEVRAASRNPDLIIMVGGPIFVINPGWVAEVGADATAQDARDAPRVAARLLMATPVRR